MLARRLRALSRGPTRLRPTVGAARRPCGIVGAPLIEGAGSVSRRSCVPAITPLGCPQDLPRRM